MRGDCDFRERHGRHRGNKRNWPLYTLPRDQPWDNRQEIKQWRSHRRQPVQRVLEQQQRDGSTGHTSHPPLKPLEMQSGGAAPRGDFGRLRNNKRAVPGSDANSMRTPQEDGAG